MVFNLLDTPRTEAGDQTRLSGINDPDFTTENSIPSPSKDGNDLLKQIRGMRAPPQVHSPRSRLPLAERQNAPAKGEFTPLLKSATKNNLKRSTNSARTSLNGNMETPAGLKASYLGRNSPQLPLNSSVIIEEDTASSAGNNDAQQSLIAPHISSSSALSTPLALTARPGDGPLDKAGNLATLREQEARLEQLDKENFSLKLKIHFLEDLLRRSGKEFNETAIKENTDLKVDKISLQRDLKHSRKLLAQAQKDLQEYKQQLSDYMEKLKRRHANENEESQEAEQLRQTIAEQESTIKDLQEKLDTAQNLEDQVEKLQDECGDLEAEIRQKDLELDEKDEQLQALKDKEPSDNDLAEQLEEKTRLLEQKEEDVEALQEALKAAEADTQQKLDEKERLLEEKDDELRELEDRLNAADGDQSLIRSKNKEAEEFQRLLEQKDSEIDELKQKVTASTGDASLLRRKDGEIDELNQKLATSADDESLLRRRDGEIKNQNQQIMDLKAKLAEIDQLKREVEDLKSKLQSAEDSLASERKEKQRLAQENDQEIQALQQRVEASRTGDSQIEDLQDKIADLEADLRAKEQAVEEKEDAIENLNEDLRQAKQQADDELIECEDRIQQLEMEQGRHLEELQSLRDQANKHSAASTDEFGRAQARIKELEGEQSFAKEQEKQLRNEINSFRDQIQRLESTIRDNERKHNEESDNHKIELRSFEWEKDKAYELANDLQRTVTQLRESQGSASEREVQMQQNLESEQVRHRYAEDELRQQIDQISTDSQKRFRTLQETEQQLQDVKRQYAAAERQRNAGTSEEKILRDKIQGLEDEIEVLQTSHEEDAENSKRELASVRDQADSLRRQIRSLQQDLAQSQRQANEVKLELNKEQEKVYELERDQVNPAGVSEQGAAESNSRLHSRFLDLQTQLSKIQMEKATLQDDLATSNADLGGLRLTISDLEASRETAQKQARELRQQLQTMQREHERKIQSNIISYEHDINNLEQELAESQSKQAGLEAENQAAQQKVSRLESKIKSLEESSRAQKASNDTNVAERKDLHEMLKDAKLEAEDLAIQIQERDARMASTATKETELRDQLKRLREDRSTQSSRADALARELETTCKARDDLIEEMTSLQALQKQVRFPRNSVSISGAATGNGDTSAVQKRHAAELRGLVKQIEYLAARCRREERFRADLTYIKQYFTKQVEMHARYTEADLRLVRAMGIPVEDVAEEQQAEMDLAVGRVQTNYGSRPSFKCVGLMVLASCRMRRSASQWSRVKKSHDALMKKLVEIKGKRNEAGLKGIVDADLAPREKSKGSIRVRRGSPEKHVGR